MRTAGMADGNETAEIQDAVAKLTSGDLFAERGPVRALRRMAAGGDRERAERSERDGAGDGRRNRLAGRPHGAAQGFRAGRVRLLHEPGKPQGTAARRRAEGGALLPLEVAAPAGARARHGGAGHAGGGRRLFRDARRASAGSAPGRAGSREPLESRFALEKAVARYTARFAAGSDSAPAALVGLPHRAGGDRVLARRRLPPA